MTDDAWVHDLLHFRPREIRRRLDGLVEAGEISTAPTLWQLLLGVAYMWHRAVYRPETIGVDPFATPRGTWRARLWRHRPLRAPALLFWKRAVNPLDHTGLGSSDAHMIRHLVGAYHPGDNFHYDLAILALAPDGLATLRRRTLAIVDGSAPDASVLRDLVVYEGYHERLLAAVDAWASGSPPELPHVNPDTTLPAFLTWCAQQPRTPSETLAAIRVGDLSFAPTVQS